MIGSSGMAVGLGLGLRDFGRDEGERNPSSSGP